MLVLETPSDRAGGQNAVAGIERGDDDKRRHGQHHEGIDEHTVMATTPCSWGRFTLAMAWACGVEPMPGLIGEQPPLDPLTDGHFQGIARPPPMMALGTKKA